MYRKGSGCLGALGLSRGKDCEDCKETQTSCHSHTAITEEVFGAIWATDQEFQS